MENQCNRLKINDNRKMVSRHEMHTHGQFICQTVDGGQRTGRNNTNKSGDKCEKMCENVSIGNVSCFLEFDKIQIEI